VAFSPVDVVTAHYQRVTAAVAKAGRPTKSMTYSACFAACAGRDDSEVNRRAEAIGQGVDELRTKTPLVGTPGEIVDALGPFARAGVRRCTCRS
jgi:alkanesulfonate monooxygenase SsuD/methylene tetrahydromethanopterin reductase-like flavin-dependent oxidoreductase (luciferase family)